MGAAYSSLGRTKVLYATSFVLLGANSLGRTKVLYATSFVLLGAKAKFLRRKPSVLVALEEISETC